MATIKITSVPKHAPFDAKPESQEWKTNDLEFARKLILEQRVQHKLKSKWFLIFINEKLVFNSNMIHGGKSIQIPINQLALFQ